MAWALDQKMPEFTDSGGRSIVPVVILNGGEQRCELLWFPSSPSNATVDAAVTRLLANWNRSTDRDWAVELAQASRIVRRIAGVARERGFTVRANAMDNIADTLDSIANAERPSS